MNDAARILRRLAGAALLLLFATGVASASSIQGSHVEDRNAAKVSKRPAASFESWLFTKNDAYRDPNMVPNLEALQANSDIVSITVSDNAPITVTVAQITSDAVRRHLML